MDEMNITYSIPKDGEMYRDILNHGKQIGRQHITPDECFFCFDVSKIEAGWIPKDWEWEFREYTELDNFGAGYFVVFQHIQHFIPAYQSYMDICSNYKEWESLQINIDSEDNIVEDTHSRVRCKQGKIYELTEQISELLSEQNEAIRIRNEGQQFQLDLDAKLTDVTGEGRIE